MAIETRRRKSGTRYRVTFRVSGKKAPSKTFKRRVDAEAWERKMLFGRDSGEIRPPIPHKEQAISLDDLRTRFDTEYAACRQAPSTRLLEERLYRKHVAPYLGAIRLNKFERQRIEDFFLTLLRDKKLTAKRVNRVRTLLHGMLNQAVRWQLMAGNPVHETRPFPTSNGALEESMNYLSQQEAAKLLDWLESSDPWLYPKVRTLLNTGIRYGEMVALQTQDVVESSGVVRLIVSRNFDKHTMTFRDQTKGKRSRVIPLGDGMATFLLERARRKRAESPLLWEDWKECHSNTKFQKHFRRALDSVGVRRIRVHDLRHTFAVHFLERGGHIYDLQKLLGHTTIRLTERYSHFSAAMVERARGIVDHHADPASPKRPPFTVIDGGERSTMSPKRPPKAVLPVIETLDPTKPTLLN